MGPAQLPFSTSKQSLMWYRELVEASITRRHIFWHSGALHRVEPLDRAIVASAPEGCSATVVDCKNPPLTQEHDLDVQNIAERRANLLVFTNIDQLLRAKRGNAWLRQLRAPVMQLLDQGVAVLVASNVPRRSYPPIDGSSVATDCYQYIMRPNANDVVKSMPLDSEHVDWVVTACVGSRAVASTLLNSDLEISQKRRAVFATEKLKFIISVALLECGAEVLAWIEDEFLLRRRQSFQSDEVPFDVLETMTASGLAEIDAVTDTLRIFPRIYKKTAADAIILANSTISQAPDEWATAAKLLFEFERLLRRIIDGHIESHQHLRTSTIESYENKILNNYKYDTGINEKVVSKVPLPWNWVELSDLFNLAEKFATNQRLAGLTARAWQRAHEDVLPFRNRIQHMRLPRPGEVEHLRSLIRELRLSLRDDMT